ncbi:MAG: hypothetical protein U0168_06855 [Nannocystaceae bacterium]
MALLEQLVFVDRPGLAHAGEDAAAAREDGLVVGATQAQLEFVLAIAGPLPACARSTRPGMTARPRQSTISSASANACGSAAWAPTHAIAPPSSTATLPPSITPSFLDIAAVRGPARAWVKHRVGAGEHPRHHTSSKMVRPGTRTPWLRAQAMAPLLVVARVDVADHAHAGIRHQHPREPTRSAVAAIGDDGHARVQARPMPTAATVMDWRSRRRAGSGVDQRVEDGPVRDGVRAALHALGLAVGRCATSRSRGDCGR